MSWQDAPHAGEAFIRGRETRTVTDRTLGGDVLYFTGTQRRRHHQVTETEWNEWASGSSQVSDKQPEYEYVPIEFYGRAGYDTSGGLTYVEVLCSGREPTVIAHPEPGESIGAVFQRAFEGAKTLLLTQVFAPPADGEITRCTPPADDTKPAGKAP